MTPLAFAGPMSNATHNALLTTNAIVAAAYAVALLIVPARLIETFGSSVDEAGPWIARLLGAALLGFAAVSLFARRVEDVEARRALDAGFLVGWASVLGISMWAQYLQAANGLGWVNVAVAGVFAVAYFWFLAAEDQAAPMEGRPT